MKEVASRKKLRHITASMLAVLLTVLFVLGGCSFPVRQPGIHDFAEDKVTVRVESNAGDYSPQAVQSNPEEWARVEGEAERACALYNRSRSNLVTARCGVLGEPGSILFPCREWPFLFACSTL